MRISALCNHLRHPLTYTDAQGKSQQLSWEEIGQVTLFVLSSTAAATFEAVTSQRSLKSSSVSIVIVTGSSFYLATAIIKASKGNSSSKPGEDLLRKNTNPVTKTLHVSSIGSLDKSGWQVVDQPNPVKKNNNQQVNHSLEVSANGLKDNSGWTYLESQLQETRIETIMTTGNKPESPKKEEYQAPEDKIMQISVVGSPDKTEWVYTGDSTTSPISTKNTPVVTAEVKKDDGTNLYSSEVLFEDMASIYRAEIEKEQKKEPVLTVSVFGPEVSNWTAVKSNAPETYQQLTVSSDQILVISEMIKTIGDTWLAALYFKKAELLEMGKKIEDVHPLKFLETILNDPGIKKSMLDIKGNSWKWDGFLKGDKESPGFINKCQREDNLGNFEPYIKDFCKAVKFNSKSVLLIFKTRDWEKLISFLVQ